MRICFVLTAPFAFNAFVASAVRALLMQGWQVTVVLSMASGKIADDIARDVEVIDLNISRAISTVNDLRVLFQLVRLFQSRQFDIVHSLMPKSGLLAMIAARLAGVKVRVHTFTGQVWVTRRGPMRWLLRSLDWVLAKCATSLLADSASQCDFLINDGIVAQKKIQVLANGSVCGADTDRFRPKLICRSEIRAELGIPSDAVVLVYVGRMHIEKGVVELAQSFNQLAADLPALHLLLVGPDEGALKPALSAVTRWTDRVHCVGLTTRPESYLAAADIFCLASYREGFGLSIIEAASAGLPCVAFKIYGVTDAVVHGVTGLLAPPRNVDAFISAIATLVRQQDLRQKMGLAAMQRVSEDFSQAVVVQAWLDFYKQEANR
jgi:glycosyltransferase involved in cell wall biosynthesis